MEFVFDKVKPFYGGMGLIFPLEENGCEAIEINTTGKSDDLVIVYQNLKVIKKT